VADNADGYTCTHWHQIRYLCIITTRRAGRGYKAGETVFESNARATSEHRPVPLLLSPLFSHAVITMRRSWPVHIGMASILTRQIFCSTSHSINVQKIFKIVLAKAFDLKVRHQDTSMCSHLL
jgi:hypothetical protein